jgi:hypothetical protein
MAARPGRRPARPNRVAARLEGDREQLGEWARRRGELRAVEEPDLDHEWLLATYDGAMAYALGEMEQTFLDTPGEWSERMRAALERLLALAAANPEPAHLCTIGIFDAGARGLARRDHWIGRFMELCRAGYEQSDTAGAPSRLIPPVAAGAVFELIRSHVAENRLAQLPDALPTATLIVLAPILGRDEAIRTAG